MLQVAFCCIPLCSVFKRKNSCLCKRLLKMCSIRVRWTNFEAETTFTVLFLSQKPWLVNQWSESMWLHMHALVVTALVWLFGRATPGPPSRPTCCVVRTTSLSISCAKLKFNYSWVFSLSHTMQLSMAKCSLLKHRAGCLSLRVKGAYCLLFHWGSAFLEECLFMCERWFVCVWWADAWYFNCGLNRYIMQICLWCCLPSINWQKAFMTPSSRNQCQKNSLRSLKGYLVLCE